MEKDYAPNAACFQDPRGTEETCLVGYVWVGQQTVQNESRINDIVNELLLSKPDRVQLYFTDDVRLKEPSSRALSPLPRITHLLSKLGRDKTWKFEKLI